MLSWFGLPAIYSYCAVGAYCAIQATYFKWRMSVDPSYKPDCNCASDDSGQLLNGVLTVLEHKKGTLLFNVPNSVFGILYYLFMIVLFAVNISYGIEFISLLNIISVVGSTYLWFVMVTEVKSICILCTTIHVVNFLTAVWLFC